MRIVCISDTHNKHRNINLPDGDVLIHAGDFTNQGKYTEFVVFSNWLLEIKHKYKKIFLIAGNHDFLMQNNPSIAYELLDKCEYLYDKEFVYDGLKFYGSPWTPWFHDWAFNLNRGSAIAAKWEMIPNDTNVLITHGPAYGILDKNKNDEHCGCKDLYDRLSYLVDLEVHISGHLHEARGTTKQGKVTFVNSSICDLFHNPINPPIVVDI